MFALATGPDDAFSSQNLGTPRAASGLDAIPGRLCALAEKFGNWDPKQISLIQDKRDWALLSEPQKLVLLHVLTQFFHGEDNVAREIGPFLRLKQRQGKTEEAAFLETFMRDESNHARFFRRYFNQVIGFEPNSPQFRLPHYTNIFDVALPRDLRALEHDDSPRAEARAAVTYMMICEGVVAETGYEGLLRALGRAEIMPGLRVGLEYIKRDETRHIGYGAYALRRIVEEHGLLKRGSIISHFLKQVPDIIGIVDEIFALSDPFPFELTWGEMLKHAYRLTNSRRKIILKGEVSSLNESLEPVESSSQIVLNAEDRSCIYTALGFLAGANIKHDDLDGDSRRSLIAGLISGEPLTSLNYQEAQVALRYLTCMRDALRNMPAVQLQEMLDKEDPNSKLAHFLCHGDMAIFRLGG